MMSGLRDTAKQFYDSNINGNNVTEQKIRILIYVVFLPQKVFDTTSGTLSILSVKFKFL